MAMKSCCVNNCLSNSSREEDKGVTYHRFPRDVQLHNIWVLNTQHIPTNTSISFVCSRHFRKSDFRIYEDSKYVLKTDAIPSIFTWSIMEVDHDDKSIQSNENETVESAVSTVDIKVHNEIDTLSGAKGNGTEKEIIDPEQNDTTQTASDENINTESIVPKLNSTKSDGDNLNEIKEFLNNQDTQKDDYLKKDEHEINTTEKEKLSDKELCNVLKTEASSVASNVMDMILNGAEATISKLKDNKVSKPIFTSPDRGNSNNALSVGTKVEAKDYEELWHPAEITEVDFEEMEVLVHYDLPLKKPDEWISVSSSRLRPFGSKPRNPPTAVLAAPAMAPPAAAAASADEQKDDKHRASFAEGERCLARWRDNRRFIATIKTDLGDGNFEVVFDDGVTWKCPSTRLYKLKDCSVKCEPVDLPSSSQVSPAALQGSAASAQPPYHKHLFDPARDYLGSKSERRALKRKLNIKEIFNIGQKKMKKEYVPREKVPRPAPVKKPPAEKKSKVAKKKVEIKDEVKSEVQSDIPDAVASIIGTKIKDDPSTVHENEVKQEQAELKSEADSMESFTEEMEVKEEIVEEGGPNLMQLADIIENKTLEPVDEEQMLENFDSANDNKHEEVIDKIKEAIKKMEDGLNEQLPESPKPAVKEVPKEAEKEPAVEPAPAPVKVEVVKKKCKWKKSKKLRSLQERRVKRQVQRVRDELEEMKRQVEAMRREMMSGEAGGGAGGAGGAGRLLAGEWACRWRGGQPLGAVSELPPDRARPHTLPRRSVHVEDKRLPEGWTKHMVRRSYGSSAGKWDVVLINAENQRFHTRAEMRNYLEREPALAAHSAALLDFGVHLKLARRLGWVQEGGEGDGEGEGAGQGPPAPPGEHSPLVKRRPPRRHDKKRRHKQHVEENFENTLGQPKVEPVEEEPPLVAEEGYVYVGSLKVQIVDNLLRCPAEGCLKNFRNKTLLKMHMKHYHREARRLLGTTPNVLDLVYERRPDLVETAPLRREHKPLKVKITRPKLQKVPVVELAKIDAVPQPEEVKLETSADEAPPLQDSPQLRSVLEAAAAAAVKRAKVLLPVRAADVDVEDAISAHAVPRHPRAAPREPREQDVPDEQDEPDVLPAAPDSDSDSARRRLYVYDEFGRRIKLVHMKREEIINCACGFREEDGLMVQCELCLCWQHGACHGILAEQDVPEKYTCSICLNPRRGRRSMRFVHEQEHLYCGALPGAGAGAAGAGAGAGGAGRGCHSLRRSFELAANLLRIQDALHALALKYYVLCKKNHPKLYLWAKDWETTEISLTQEKLNSDYSDLNIMINDIGKENLPIKSEDNLSMGIKTPPPEDQESKWSVGAAGCSPGSLELPISSAELERLAQAVAEQELQAAQAVTQVSAPQPEAAIENSVCVARLLRHVQRCQASVDARLTSIEAQVAELESQDPSFEDDETAEYFPRTKQTIQMLMRDLDTMEELGLTTQCT